MSKPQHHKTQGVVLISGHGSNLQAIIDACKHGLAFKILAVISDRADAYGLTRARQADIPTHVIAPGDHSNRRLWDQALLSCLQSYPAELVVCAGFMRILHADTIAAYRHRIINVHPSLLPKYPGLHTHQQVLDHGDHTHGCTVHLVTAALDQGPILEQAQVTVTAEDTAASLATKVQAQEHRILPKVIAWYATGKLTPGQAPAPQ